jgi:squalene-hopene/tetraprenyl-beta-curcumene cyclase
VSPASAVQAAPTSTAQPLSETRELRARDLALDVALEKARLHVLARQRTDGSWQERADMGPLSTALSLVTLAHVGALADTDLTEGCRFLRGAQLPDGSFPGRPFSSTPDLATTAAGWAALSLSRHEADRAAAQAAGESVQAQGGADAVCKLGESGDIAPVLLCLTGLLEPARVKSLPLSSVLVPGLFELCSRRVVFYGLTTLLSCSLTMRGLRDRASAPGRFRRMLNERENARAVELLTLYQSRNGSLMNVVYHTALLLPALAAAGLPLTDPRLAGAIAFLRGRATRGKSGLFFDVYGSDVWSTASYLRALLVSGSERSSGAVMRAVEWLLGQQCSKPHPALTNPQPGASRTGGWGFQSNEDAYPDCDTTSTVLDSLARALLPVAGATTSLPSALAARVCASIASARAWLLAMQNSDGGWPSFFWGHPGKRPGPIMLRPLRLDFSELRAADVSAWLRKIAEASEHLSDPATEDVTSRVLSALARSGTAASAPAAQRALAFLHSQQCPSGAFWGRWKVNYLPVTACVVSALAALGEDVKQDLPRRALAWLMSRQNADGGFGEGIASYRDPSLAGVGPSTAPLTGSVLLGLVEGGEVNGDVALRAARYLLETQAPDGAWPNGDCVAPLVPPDLFYVYHGAARYIPLEALARYRALLAVSTEAST